MPRNGASFNPSSVRADLRAILVFAYVCSKFGKHVFPTKHQAWPNTTSHRQFYTFAPLEIASDSTDLMTLYLLPAMIWQDLSQHHIDLKLTSMLKCVKPKLL